MEDEHSVAPSAGRLPEDAKLHEILDERVSRCRSHVRHTGNVVSSELRRFVELIQELLRPREFLPRGDQAG